MTNETTEQWYQSLSSKMKTRLATYAPDADWQGAPAGSLIRLLWASSAGHVIIPVQDLLGLDGSGRMNTPGQEHGNWAWRLESFKDCADPLRRLAEMTVTYERQVRPLAGR